MTPEAASESTKFAFVMKFDHRSTLESDKENEPYALEVPILSNYVNLFVKISNELAMQ